MLYSLVRPLLFLLDAERAHYVTLNSLSVLNTMRLIRPPRTAATSPCEVMGLRFANRVGLAAGLDKNAEYIAPLGQCGFGFLEVGTVTPQPQAGNPKPRLFRLPKEQAIINRMGFNNNGLQAMVERLAKHQYQGVLGVNIGKNKVTPNDRAKEDYCQGMEAVYPWADYITINISSPNTPDLRALQGEKPLMTLLEALKNKQQALQGKHARTVPLVVKVAPDLSKVDIQTISKAVVETGIEGIIATNTTIARPLRTPLKKDIQGGLSGAPLMSSSTDVLKAFSDTLQGKVALIASGGVMCAEDALQKRAAGADLVQLYTGLIYKGPALIKDILSVK